MKLAFLLTLASARIVDLPTLAFAVAVYLACKMAIIWFIWKKITVRKTRNRLLTFALIFSPTLYTLAWFKEYLPDADYFCSLPALGVILDLGIINWVRAIYEPPDTTKDLDYPENDFTPS